MCLNVSLTGSISMKIYEYERDCMKVSVCEFDL